MNLKKDWKGIYK